MMKIAALLICVCVVAGLTGCASLIPKSVEFGQNKVKAFPKMKPREKELQRQAAQRAEQKAKETLEAAIKEDSSAAVIVPATETAVLTDVLAESLGPPNAPASKTKPSDDLAQELRSAIAKLNKRLDNFKEDNNENTGQKIEGTGWFQVSYFLWIGIVIGVLFLVKIVLQTLVSVAAAGSPPVAMGMKVASVGGKLLSKGFSQLVKGGENFKNTIKAEVKDADLQAKLLAAFQAEHKKAQDAEVQNLIKGLTTD